MTSDGRFAYLAIVSPLAVVDVAADTLVAYVFTQARGVAVAPDRKHVHVTNLNASSATVIDAETDTVVTMIPVGGSPRQLTIGPRATGSDPTANERLEVPDSRFRLIGNAPNPFTDRTEILFELNQAGSVLMQVFDVQGRLVRTLYEDRAAVGLHTIAWDGSSDNGEEVVSGVYVVRLSMPGGQQTKTVTRI